MSIVPVGKRKHQVNQGGFKHESMLNTDVFASLVDKIALTPGSVLDREKEPPPPNNVPDDLQSAMNQGGLDPEQGMPEGADGVGVNPPKDQQMDNIGDPGSQAQDSTVHRDFATIAQELSQFLSESSVLSQSYMLVDQKRDQRSGRWTFVIEPAAQPELSPNKVQQSPSPPFLGGGGGGGPAGDITQTV